MRTSGPDELRRAGRARVCCRIDVRQRHAAWSAVTDELSPRGCRIVTRQLPRLGASLDLTLSSDLVPEVLEVAGEVVWIDSERVGVLFADAPERAGSLSAVEWVGRVLAEGRVEGTGGERHVPAVREPAQRAPARRLGVVGEPGGGRAGRRRSG